MKTTDAEAALVDEFACYYQNDLLEDWGSEDFVDRHAKASAERLRQVSPNGLAQLKDLLRGLATAPDHALLDRISEATMVAWKWGDELTVFQQLVGAILAELEDNRAE